MDIQAPVVIREAHTSIDDGSCGGEANDVRIWRIGLGQVFPDGAVRRIEVGAGQGDFPGETGLLGIGNSKAGIGAADITSVLDIRAGRLPVGLLNQEVTERSEFFKKLARLSAKSY